MPDQVDAPVNRVKPTCLHPHGDCLRTHPEREQLSTSHYPMLNAREPRDQPVRATRSRKSPLDRLQDLGGDFMP